MPPPPTHLKLTISFTSTSYYTNQTHKSMKGQDTTTLCAVGGLIVGAATLSLSSNAVIKQTLRGTERAKDGEDSMIGSDRILPLTSISSDKDATLVDTGEKSIEEEDVEILYEWRGEEHLNSTTLEAGQSMMYSERILKEIDNSISRRTNLFSSSGFRLKLFWREGYYWQERNTETFWCMGCGDCKENDVIKLTNCKTKTDADAQFKRIRQKRGDQYRVVGTNLCLQKLGRRGTKITLKPCKKNNAWQQFTGFRGNGESFDIRVRKQKGRCLTNHHHPKKDEVVYAESCYKAHKTKTGYWTEY